MASRWLAPFLYFVLQDSRTRFEQRFEVIWSVPFEPCFKRLPENITRVLEKAGILINQGGIFQGEKITTFYKLGLYPRITKDGDVNGGIPQLVDVESHLARAFKDIEDSIPDSNFSGLALIDWEAWRPIFDFNFASLQIYQRRSIELVRGQHPDWPVANCTREAKIQWESASRKFMDKTMKLAKAMRPKAKWCFYGFPDCYNYYGQTRPEQYFCEGNIMEGNDQLQWMWERSSALCPSMYVKKQQLTDYNLTQRSWYTHGRILESIRVGGYNAPLYPYINYYVFDGGKTVPQGDFARLLGQTAALGVDGVVIWGSSKNVATKADCQSLYNYIKGVIVPSLSTLRKNLRLCSEMICKGKAKCVWDKRAYYAWRQLFENKPKFRVEDISCVYKP